MYIPDETVEEVRSKNDIVDVVSSYVRLKRAGSNYQGLCPFHNEKSPSFSVSPSKQIYKCFGCGKSGNVVTFVMEYENMNFQDSIKLLADRAGVKLPEIKFSAEESALSKTKREIQEMYKEAAIYFHNVLKTPEGQIGYKYLKDRALSDQLIVRFGLGFSPTGGSNLYKTFKEKGYSDKAIKESQLFRFDEKNGARDMFWNRVMFPIMDINNKVIAFGGRVMGDAKPKYLNSNETLIFNKSNTLYGLNISRRTRRDFVILCEGYMDVIALHQAGFDNAIASLGTALTGQHAMEIKKLRDKKVYLSYDSDEAGVKAALRAIPILSSRGLITYVINMRPYKDPDEFIKALGADEYQKRIEEAVPGFDFRIRQLETHYNLKSGEETNEFYNEVAKICLEADDEFDRSNYIRHVEEMYSLEKNQFMKFVSRKASTFKPSEIKRDEDYETKAIKKQNEQALAEYSKERLECEKLVLTWSVSDSVYSQIFVKRVKVDDFQPGIPRTIAGKIYDKFKAGEKVIPASFSSYFENTEEQSLVADLFQAQLWEQMPEDIKIRDKAFADSIVKLVTFAVNSRSVVKAEDLKELIKLKSELPKMSSEILLDIERLR